MKYIFLDFNGTVLNDVELCLDILNVMLKGHRDTEVSLEEYKNVFGFPIEQYYKNVGFDFSVKSFEDLSIDFIELFQKNSLVKASIYDDVLQFIEKNKEDYKVILCSASQIDNLLEQVNHFKISNYFDDIIGLDNILAKSKKELAKQYILKNNINSNDIIFIGDTVHDYEVATHCNAKCILVSNGHQSYERLKKVSEFVVASLSEVELN